MESSTENRIFEANADKKTFVFDEQEVQYIKFVAKESNDGWVAVSEFDIANKAEQTFTVDATKGGTVSGGKEAKQGEEVTLLQFLIRDIYLMDGIVLQERRFLKMINIYLM